MSPLENSLSQQAIFLSATFLAFAWVVGLDEWLMSYESIYSWISFIKIHKAFHASLYIGFSFVLFSFIRFLLMKLLAHTQKDI